MKKIYLNLKRFDIPKTLGGVNTTGLNDSYGKTITSFIEKMDGVEFTVFFQESSILSAVSVANNVKIGCQGVHFEDVFEGGNFGAFTSLRTAKSMKAIGCKASLIGHCEERKNLNYLTSYAGVKADINPILNKEIKCALDAGLEVLYCVGEQAEEQEHRYEVIKNQLEVGLKDVDLNKISIAYEPLWAIGPSKIPPDKDYIEDITKFIKSVVNVPVVYGGGLKKENAEMLASIPELDGGLIALTRFGKDFGFNLDDYKEIVETYKKGLK